ncbi:hypothetical protein BC2230_30563 [Burkholderia cepacia]
MARCGRRGRVPGVSMRVEARQCAGRHRAYHPAFVTGQHRAIQRPRVVYADRGHDSERHRRALRNRGIQPVIAKRRAGHGSGLGKYRWMVERTHSWLHSFRRLRTCFERRADIHEAFLKLGCPPVCWNIFRRIDHVTSLELDLKVGNHVASEQWVVIEPTNIHPSHDSFCSYRHAFFSFLSRSAVRIRKMNFTMSPGTRDSRR